MRRKLTKLLIFIVLSGILVFLTFNRHSKSGYFNYHSEIWADKAGYYVYLPATFIYSWDPCKFPEQIDKRTGDGFRLNCEDGKIKTKYTYGVALMELPWFLVAHTFAHVLEMPADGFSPVYHWSINMSAITFFILALMLLDRVLKISRTAKSRYLTLAIIFLGTNLYYYAVDETGMSHIYSFALFSYYLLLLKKSEFLREVDNKLFLKMGMIGALIVLIRPINLLFLSCTLFLKITDKNSLTKRLKLLFQFKSITLLIMGGIVIWLPQMIYWKLLSGNLFNYSYGEEGFDFTHPVLFQTWFAPNNGLFTYTPLYFVILSAIVLQYKDSKLNTSFYIGVFVLLSYILASWWDPTFGCSFGNRNFIEYLALFSLPLATFLTRLRRYPLKLQVLFFAIISVCVGVNLKLTYTFDDCFFGSPWNWEAYLKLLTEPTK